MNADVDFDKGNYCLIIHMLKDSRIKIGAKGFMFFKRGYYVYVGSALNSLSKRVTRHLSDNKKKHWHVDYLLLNKNTIIEEVIYTYCSKKIECEVSCEISEDADDYIKVFGCSDCNCVSHLHYFEGYDDAINSSINSYKKIDYKPIIKKNTSSK